MVVAALLHFFFLAVFFLMLVEGVDILLAVTAVFSKQSKMKMMIAVAWGISRYASLQLTSMIASSSVCFYFYSKVQSKKTFYKSDYARMLYCIYKP